MAGIAGGFRSGPELGPERRAGDPRRPGGRQSRHRKTEPQDTRDAVGRRFHIMRAAGRRRLAAPDLIHNTKQ
ncbi:hypothetical protein OZX67_05150 [Bifidobacterium sp. ESL0728]|uniref:hypothetical protein n=1 Tax=Bifidobacterium sp. ESL0728 TaxID=2983220 RepID=UPI0023F85A85|nr:hypothetical protein [Bifidobacterium sp. ESL0728]WEV58230.1 hypothetical protein OZX67_05150 [Bifidobacterium sp. ESL0728]